MMEFLRSTTVQALPPALPRLPATNKMTESDRKHESHQRRNAAASLPPRSGLHCITHRAESIPLPLPIPLFHSFISIPLSHSRKTSALRHQLAKGLGVFWYQRNHRS